MKEMYELSKLTFKIQQDQNNQQMSIYSGFGTRKQEQQYDKLVHNLVWTLMIRINRFYGHEKVDEYKFWKIMHQYHRCINALQHKKSTIPKLHSLFQQFIKIKQYSLEYSNHSNSSIQNHHYNLRNIKSKNSKIIWNDQKHQRNTINKNLNQQNKTKFNRELSKLELQLQQLRQQVQYSEKQQQKHSKLQGYHINGKKKKKNRKSSMYNQLTIKDKLPEIFNVCDGLQRQFTENITRITENMEKTSNDGQHAIRKKNHSLYKPNNNGEIRIKDNGKTGMKNYVEMGMKNYDETRVKNQVAFEETGTIPRATVLSYRSRTNLQLA